MAELECAGQACGLTCDHAAEHNLQGVALKRFANSYDGLKDNATHIMTKTPSAQEVVHVGCVIFLVITHTVVHIQQGMTTSSNNLTRLQSVLMEIDYQKRHTVHS